MEKIIYYRSTNGKDFKTEEEALKEDMRCSLYKIVEDEFWNGMDYYGITDTIMTHWEKISAVMALGGLTDKGPSEKETSKEAMTLGELIDVLYRAPGNLPVNFSNSITNSVLGFSVSEEGRLVLGKKSINDCTFVVGELLELCEKIIGQPFRSCRGHKYYIDRTTPIFVKFFDASACNIEHIIEDATIRNKEVVLGVEIL